MSPPRGDEWYSNLWDFPHNKPILRYISLMKRRKQKGIFYLDQTEYDKIFAWKRNSHFLARSYVEKFVAKALNTAKSSKKIQWTKEKIIVGAWIFCLTKNDLFEQHIWFHWVSFDIFCWTNLWFARVGSK